MAQSEVKEEMPVREGNIFKQEKFKSPEDGGFIAEKTKIVRLKAENRLAEINNCLLGAFTAAGDYFIESPIVYELIKMKKQVLPNAFAPSKFLPAKKEAKQEFDVLFADSIGVFEPAGKFHFSVKFSREDGIKVARLNLLESVERVNGYITNVNTYTLAKFSDKNTVGDEQFEEQAREAFNIAVIDSGDTDTDPDAGMKAAENFAVILMRLNYLRTAGRIIERNSEKIEEKFFTERVSALTNNLQGRLLTDKFELEKDKIGRFFLQDKTTKFRALNQLLNNILDNADLTKLPLDAVQRIEKANTEYGYRVETNVKLTEKQIKEEAEKAEKLTAGITPKPEPIKAAVPAPHEVVAKTAPAPVIKPAEKPAEQPQKPAVNKDLPKGVEAEKHDRFGSQSNERISERRIKTGTEFTAQIAIDGNDTIVKVPATEYGVKANVSDIAEVVNVPDETLVADINVPNDETSGLESTKPQQHVEDVTDIIGIAELTELGKAKAKVPNKGINESESSKGRSM